MQVPHRKSGLPKGSTTIPLICAAVVVFAAVAVAQRPGRSLPWLDAPAQETIADRFSPPNDYTRLQTKPRSFAAWLRSLPLKPGKPAVHLHDGSEKYNQDAHVAVLDIDVGKRDLQQCADAVMRFWAEYLWSVGRHDLICFRSAAGNKAKWTKWRDGYRPPKGKAGPWKKVAAHADGYRRFRKYLNKVFGIANSASLLRQMSVVKNNQSVEIGDVFIEGATRAGYGHAVTVMDVAENSDGQRIFLLSQSYMPAQDIHILKNPSNPESPWYEDNPTEPLRTPEWTFAPGSLRRLKRGGC